MNLLYGEIVDVFEADGLRMGRIRVNGATKCVPLELVPDADVGAVVLICDGVAIGQAKEGANHVPGHSR